jgi:hypothetical protein
MSDKKSRTIKNLTGIKYHNRGILEHSNLFICQITNDLAYQYVQQSRQSLHERYFQKSKQVYHEKHIYFEIDIAKAAHICWKGF